jgi:hypothetical protein
VDRVDPREPTALRGLEDGLSCIVPTGDDLLLVADQQVLADARHVEWGVIFGDGQRATPSSVEAPHLPGSVSLGTGVIDLAVCADLVDGCSLADQITEVRCGRIAAPIPRRTEYD